MLITEDSVIAGVTEVKLSSNKKIKVQFFPGTQTEYLMFHFVSNLKTNRATSLFILGRMMRHIKIKTSFTKNSSKSKIWS